MMRFLRELFCRHRYFLIGLTEGLNGRSCRITRTFECSRCKQIKTVIHDVRKEPM